MTKPTLEDGINCIMDLLVKENVMSRVKKDGRWAYVQNQKQYNLFVLKEQEITEKMRKLEVVKA